MLAYILGISAGLLAVVPPIGIRIPLMINSYSWLFMVVATGFLGMFLTFTKLPTLLKILNILLFAGCFLSEVPYMSFNVYVLVVLALYGYIAFLECDFEIVLNFIAAAFLLEMIVTIAQLCGRDTLMNFNNHKTLFLGTVFQYMRFSSLLAIMAPLLVWKDKRFIFPILVFCALSRSSSFGLAVITGTAVYVFLQYPKYRKWAVVAGVLGLVGFAFWDIGSFRTAFTCGRIPVWGAIIRTWVMDTSGPFKLPLSGPIDWQAIFVGRGMDTFLPMFPVYKHDANPFPQAHQMYLQWFWELGVFVTGIILAYCGNLLRRLYLGKKFLLVAGLVTIGVNGFFAFPDRMTSTILLMIAFLALCEQVVRGIDNEGEHYAC